MKLVGIGSNVGKERTKNNNVSHSQEGLIGIWDMKMKQTNQLKVESGLVKSRNLWITSMAVLNNTSAVSHKIAIASTSKEISESIKCSSIIILCFIDVD